MAALKPYSGPIRTLILGIDVGTAYSGISYAILEPGKIPHILGVTRFPGQEYAAGDSKIPTFLYYRPDGSVHSAGAEAAVQGIELVAEDEDLFLSKWFKLHLCPEHLDSEEVNRRDLPALPPGKTVVEVFADFLGYLFSCARRYITDTHASGESIWNSLSDQIDFVLSHPNGLEGLQQGKMRQAAVLAGLVPDNAAGHARIHFVTEGEASLHFCVQSGLTSESIETGESVMIVDAGRDTIDISSYSFTSTTPISVEEVATAECIMEGSTSVTVRAEKFLKECLKNSVYGNEEDIKTMLDYFDKFTKPVFKDSNETSYIKFGSQGCNDPKVKIRRGQLRLSGAEMASFFQPAVDSIVAAVQRQRWQTASRPIENVFVVGSFSDNPWLYRALQTALRARSMTLRRPDTHTSKAVSEGAVSFCVGRFVSARVIRTTYGVACNHDYVPGDPEHATRTLWRSFRPSGRVVLPNGFSPILSKGTRVWEHQEISRCYVREAREQRTLNSFSTSIICYKGSAPDPHWIDVEPEMYTPLCTIRADTSKVPRMPRESSNGTYFVQVYNIVLQCGLTELKAQISWTEDGEEKRGPATIFYEDGLEEYN